jgi:thioredoxin-dependent peroxiredoxin
LKISGNSDECSPVTVAGAATALHRVPYTLHVSQLLRQGIDKSNRLAVMRSYKYPPAHWGIGRYRWAALCVRVEKIPNDKRCFMPLQINDIAPNFTAETTDGKLNFYDWADNHWVVMFSHPKDFTPVCTTELGRVAQLKPEFDKRGVKVIGLSVDPVENHAKWSADIAETQGMAPNYPMIGDTDLKVAKLYGMLPADTSGTSEGRTPANNATVRNVFIISPDKRIQLMIAYPMTTGRNFDEIIRVIDSMQLTAKHKVATPSDWKQGGDVIITGAVSDEEAKTLFPGYKTHKPYLRTTKQPT